MTMAVSRPASAFMRHSLARWVRRPAGSAPSACERVAARQRRRRVLVAARRPAAAAERTRPRARAARGGPTLAWRRGRRAVERRASAHGRRLAAGGRRGQVPARLGRRAVVRWRAGSPAAAASRRRRWRVGGPRLAAIGGRGDVVDRRWRLASRPDSACDASSSLRLRQPRASRPRRPHTVCRRSRSRPGVSTATAGSDARVPPAPRRRRVAG